MQTSLGLALVHLVDAAPGVEVDPAQDFQLIGEEGLGVVGEVWVQEHFGEGDSLDGVPAQHFGEQVIAVFGA